MTTLTELYARVRAQTETDDTELSDARINDFLHEAFIRTISAETQWPSYETSWALNQTVGDATLTLDADVSQPGIVSLFDLTNNRRLEMIEYSQAEDWYFGASISTIGRPIHYSIWDGIVQLWPAYSFDVPRSYRLRGFRLPLPWSGLGPASEPDCDSRLHLALSHYAVALAYAQQEDEVLEANYMSRWQRDVEMARKVIMEPSRHRPIEMGPTGIGSPFHRTFTINTP